jgi:hypothetical protein
MAVVRPCGVPGCAVCSPIPFDPPRGSPWDLLLGVVALLIVGALFAFVLLIL